MSVRNSWHVTAAAAALALVFTRSATAQELPFGAKVGVWRLSPKAPPDQVLTLRTGEFSADFNADGKPYKALFYTLPAPLLGCGTCRSSWFDVISPKGVTMWRYLVTGSPPSGFVVTAEFFEPSGVHDLLRSERPMVVSFAVIGASAGGVLNIFRWNSHTANLEDVSGPWNQMDQVEDVQFEDLDGDGNKEVIFVHHRSSVVARFGPRSVYRWNGKGFEPWANAPSPSKVVPSAR